MTKKKQLPGRPKSDSPSSETLPKVRVRPDQLNSYRQAADTSGKTISAWVRDTLDKEAGSSS